MFVCFETIVNTIDNVHETLFSPPPPPQKKNNAHILEKESSLPSETVF